jgi:hypothetical protein
MLPYLVLLFDGNQTINRTALANWAGYFGHF